MNRRGFLALAAAAWLTPAYAAQFSATLSYDAQGRPMIDVMLNGSGPFRLVLDTGAAHTGLSAAAIETLALREAGRARVHGASGVQETPIYRLETVAVGALERRGLIAAMLPNNPSAEGHAGVLGASTFLGARISFDFAADVFSVDDSAPRAPLSGPHRTTVSFRHQTLAYCPVSVNGIEASAVIDTGARRTIANAELRAALGFAADDARLRAVENIGGATAHTTATFAAEARSIALAGHDFGGFEIAFADLAVFPQLGLADRPGLILGMDILRRARTLTLDYASAEMAIAP